MRPNLRQITLLPLVGLLAACAAEPPAPTVSTEPVTGTATLAPSPDAAPGSPRAFFAAYPEALLMAVEQSCEGPGQSVIRPTDAELRCEGLPPVDATAALILQYDGTVDDLPRYVSSIALAESDGGYVVTADNYIRVPQQEGGQRIVRFPDERLDAVITDVFVRAGGQPL